MDPFILKLFHSEVELQCQFVLLGAAQLADAEAKAEADTQITKEEWQRGKRPATRENNARIWFALQNTLVPAANLSKLLWGSQGRRQAEREELRRSLEIEGSSPLRSPDLRNDFEHFDERIELWFADENHKSYVGRNIGSPPWDMAGEVEFGHYEPATGVVTFWENSVSLPDIIAEVRRIHPRALERTLPSDLVQILKDRGEWPPADSV